jgi:voltage-gated potassium channel
LIALPVFRPLRGLRLLRFVGVGGALASFVHTEQRHRASRGLAYTVVVVAALLVSLAFVVLDVERGAPNSTIRTPGDALWWAITTATTVGYGDHVPVTTTGRIVAVIVMLCGIGLIGVVAAAIAAWFISGDSQQSATLELTAVLTALESVRQDIAELRASLGQQGQNQTATPP